MADLAIDDSLYRDIIAQPTADQLEEQEGTNNFQKAISAWRSIDLTSLIPSLDSTASEIVQYQRDCTIQRKELAQRTKEFRRLDDSTKIVEVKSLLKNYQTFIDLLTNHIKSTNSAFLSVYSSLSEAPDPYPLLEASVESLLLTEYTLPKVKEENSQLQKSVKNLTSHLEETETRLEAERKTRRSIEQGLESKTKEVESFWTAVLEEKKGNWEAKEKSLEEKVESQERLLHDLKASYEVTQRLGESLSNGGDEISHVTNAEMEIINADLERTSARLAEMEARNEQLRLELAQSASQLVNQQPMKLEDDLEYLRIRSENASLLRKIEATRVERESKKRDLEDKLRSLEREISLLKEDRDNLRIKVQKWSDYEDVKNELDILKSIEFSLADDEDTEETPKNKSLPKAKGDTLEQLLISRNKKITDELTILRVSHTDLVKQIQSLQEEISNTKTELEKAQKLNITLENDLASVHEGVNTFPSAASVAGTHFARYPHSSINPNRRGRLSPTSSIISGFDPKSSMGTTSLESLRSGEPVGGGSGILPMITAQRDRFKKMNTNLENQLSEAQGTISSLRHQVSSLQKDNLNLYEKTRYISTYNRTGPTASSSATYSSSPNPSIIQMHNSKSSGPALDRYRTEYESRLSPFAAFRGRESARAHKRMGLPERIVFSITRLVLATRTSRNIFAGYCMALHVLVFISLYWLGSIDVQQHYNHIGQSSIAAANDKILAAKSGAENWHQVGFTEPKV
ncbi:Golgi membrane protein (Coy1) [Blumeria hordei DH14]|uniref:Protein CASP n=1 Tax=Blumeria graminis f. sp. hordei (strain DH14) TaxID=546991 RepID=N1JKG0_BLUG1|nr:Golgi membrane protein (Coy1) [Blumeria hordei DH14]